MTGEVIRFVFARAQPGATAASSFGESMDIQRDNRHMRVMSAALGFTLLVLSSPAAAQTTEPRFQLSGQLATVTSSEFDSTDVGASVRLSWNPTAVLGAEAEVGFFPSDFADNPAFSKGRVEGLFGVTVGPRVGRVRPFAKLRPGFVNLSEAPRPFACIAIFPPPLACRLAAGDTLFALDAGGGIELLLNDRTVVRVDLGDRAVRYPGPVLDNDRSVRDDPCFSHDLRMAVGGGLRFGSEPTSSRVLWNV